MTALGSDDVVVLDAALASIAAPSVLTASRLITDADRAGLHPSEAAAVVGAVPKRQREFATGRALLRQLLGADRVITVGADRAPVLPDGCVGSLAHCDGLAVAAVAGTDAFAAVGIDVEPTVPLSTELAAAILRPDDPAIDAHLAFTMKEAVYKAWSRLGGGMLEHQDVRLELGPGDSFAGRVVVDDVLLHGRWVEASGHWLALVVIRDAAQAGVATLPGPAQEAGRW